MFRQLRILFLLFILLIVAVGAYLTKLRTTSWDRPLTVAIYPVNGDGSERSSRYIEGLGLGDFQDIETFFAEEANHYGLALKKPVEIVMGPALTERPPLTPKDGNILDIIWWSLKIRFWAKNVHDDYGPPSDIQLFVKYFDPQTHPRLAHSTALQKGLLGVVNAFARKREAGSNNVVIAHEFLHTLGATDKYDLQTDQPLYPIGYAEPHKMPLLPQDFAEIMAGRIPVSRQQAEQPDSLDSVEVGEATALEIGWIK
jgi:hypothetical protein